MQTVPAPHQLTGRAAASPYHDAAQQPMQCCLVWDHTHQFRRAVVVVAQRREAKPLCPIRVEVAFDANMTVQLHHSLFTKHHPLAYTFFNLPLPLIC